MPGGMDAEELFRQMFSGMGGMPGGMGGMPGGARFHTWPGGMPGGMPGANGQPVDLAQVLSGLFGGAMPGGARGGGGGGSGGRVMQEHKLSCTLEELYRGATKTETVEGNTFRVEVQPGWKPGTKVNFDDRGVRFVVHEQKHERFERYSNDLATVVTCSLLEVLFNGSQHEVRTLDGRRVAVRVPPRRLSARVACEGMPYKETDALGQRQQRRGDLVVYLFLCWPELLSQAKQWGSTFGMIGFLWLFLTNPMLCLFMFGAYRFLSSR